jgi:putative heme-binding domain-containing protein
LPRRHFHATYTTEIDPTPRPLTPEMGLMPFAPVPTKPPPPPSSDPNLVAGGNWKRGRDLFFGESLKCSTCHSVRNEGGHIGPDLSNLVSRDAASVLRDIIDPNASINPDYVSFNAQTKDGETYTGFIREQHPKEIVLAMADGSERRFVRNSIRELRPSSTSLMPSGLLESVTPQERRDLLTFLTLAKPEWDSGETFPVRRREEVEGILSRSAKVGGPLLPAFRIILVASKQDHGPGQHDYPAWQRKWHDLLNSAEKVEVVNAWEWPSEEQFQTADVAVFYFWNHDWSASRLDQLQKFLSRGGGVVVLHSSCIADQDPEVLARPLGLSAQPVRTKYRHGPLDLLIENPAAHPITRDLPSQIHFLDEPYWPLVGQTERVAVLGASVEEGAEHPLVWTYQYQGGRVFGSILGHYTWTLDDPFFRILALRGIAWAGKQQPDRFVRLATEEVNPYAP